MSIRLISFFLGLSTILTGSLHLLPFVSIDQWRSLVSPFFTKLAFDAHLENSLRFALPLNLHIFFGSLWFIIAWFQTSSHHYSWHAWSGRVGFFALFLSLSSLLAMTLMPGQPLFFNKQLELYSTVVVALLTLLCGTLSAYYIIVHRDIAMHRRFALRAFGYSMGVGVIRLLFSLYNLLNPSTHSLDELRSIFGIIFAISLLIGIVVTEIYLNCKDDEGAAATKTLDSRKKKVRSSSTITPLLPSFLFHGLILLLISTLLVGFSWTTFLVGGVDFFFFRIALPTFKGTHETFRIAHMQGITHCFLLLIVGLVDKSYPKLLSSATQREAVRIGLLAEAYGFALGQTLIMVSGQWGLLAKGPFYNSLIYSMAVVASFGFVIGMFTLFRAAYLHWYKSPSTPISSFLFPALICLIILLTLLLSALDGTVFDSQYHASSSFYKYKKSLEL